MYHYEQHQQETPAQPFDLDRMLDQLFNQQDEQQGE
jgi:hypothetical protein